MAPSTKTDAVLLIERIRRAMPLNRDVMEAMDLLERAVASTQKPVASTNEPVASTRRPAVASTDCEDCRRRRSVKAKAQGRWRAKAKRKVDPMEQSVA